MATRRKPQPKKIKFELTRSGIGGIGVIVFCLFLWMFLLGVWAGQSLLAPTPYAGKKVGSASSHADSPLQIIRAEKKAVKK